MPSCQKTSGRLTSRCSNAILEAVTPRSTISRRYAAKRTRRPRLTAPTFDWQGVDAYRRRNSDVCHTETQCKVLVAEPSDLWGWVELLTVKYGCFDIAAAVLFHISAGHYIWTRGEKSHWGCSTLLVHLCSFSVSCISFFIIKTCGVSNSGKWTSLKSKTHLDCAHYQNIALLPWHLKRWFYLLSCWDLDGGMFDTWRNPCGTC